MSNFVRSMKYRLIALDLDGTLTTDDKRVTPFTQSVLMKAQEQGVRIVLASGRPVYGMSPIASLLRLSDYGGFVMACNGGAIVDCRSARHIYNRYLDSSLISEIYDYSRGDGFEILAYVGENVVSENPGNPYVLRACMINGMKPLKVERFPSGLRTEVNKCIIVGDEKPLADLEQRIKSRRDGRFDLYRSSYCFLEIVPKGVDKASALQMIAEGEGIPRSEVVAFGDGYNDVSMIEYAGLGVAMENADPFIRSRADYVAPSNNDEGVGIVLQKLMGG